MSHDDQSEWRWHYSFWTGIMYGPIPVGIIIVLLAAGGYFLYMLGNK